MGKEFEKGLKKHKQKLHGEIKISIKYMRNLKNKKKVTASMVWFTRPSVKDFAIPCKVSHSPSNF